MWKGCWWEEIDFIDKCDGVAWDAESDKFDLDVSVRAVELEHKMERHHRKYKEYKNKRFEEVDRKVGTEIGAIYRIVE